MKTTDYPEFTRRIKIIRQMCDKLITEAEKVRPNPITISNILTDKVSEELSLAEDIFYRHCMPDIKRDRGINGIDGIMEGQVPNSLLKCKYRGRVSNVVEHNIPPQHITNPGRFTFIKFHTVGERLAQLEKL